MDWQSRLLEELIYERVRLHVDIIDLVDFERDLCSSIARALRAGGTDPSQEETLARRYVEKAWARLEQEWTRCRSRDLAECPLCESPLECPDPRGYPTRSEAMIE